MLSSFFTAFGLGFLYFISAIPTTVALGATIWWAAVSAWLGYSTGAVIMLLLGVPAQEWLLRKKNFSLTPDPQKLFWRILDRYGVIGLGLIAPVTIGPQLATLVLLALRIRPIKIATAISFGALPWTLLFSSLLACGSHFFKSQ